MAQPGPRQLSPEPVAGIGVLRWLDLLPDMACGFRGLVVAGALLLCCCWEALPLLL